MSEPTLIDWGLADRVARAVAGNGTGKRSVRRADLQRAARGSVRMVRDYSGLEPRGRPPRPEVVDRREWIVANLESLRGLTGGAEEQLAHSLNLPAPLGPGVRGAAAAAAGIEMGLASGFLAQRVLGQYDIALTGPARPPRLLFVAPNLAEAQHRLGVERRPFLRWIALHESTHVVQFSAVPWLRDHLGALAEGLLGGAFAKVGVGELAALVRGLFPPNPRRLVTAARDGEWFSPFISPPQRRLMARMQTTMAVVEGYSEHIMDAIGRDLGPGYEQMRARVDSKRESRGLLEGLLSRLLGIELKMRQYRLGKRFCDEIVERRGIATLNRVWAEPAALPRPSELERPGRWLSRVA